MQTQKPPAGVEPKDKTGPGYPKDQGAAKSGPGGLAGGADVGANAPGRTGENGRQDG
jgi:hypothetical protein